MINILHWTEGQGTGHIKRINALLRHAHSEPDLRYWVFSQDPLFTYLLPESAIAWDGQEHIHFDLLVLDLEDPIPQGQVIPGAERYIQLCRIGSPMSLPGEVEARTTRVAFERSSLFAQLNIPYFGCLLDVDERECLDREHARTFLDERIHRDFSRGTRLGLAHANSASPSAAYTFLEEAGEYLLKHTDQVLLVSGHQDTLTALAQAFHGRNVYSANIPAIYRYYSAFDYLVAPMGYNTYCEVNLFFSR